MRNFLVDIDAQELDIDVDLVRAAVLATLRHQGMDIDGEVSVLAVEDDEMVGLNRQYRGKDGPTDVLSFPQYYKEDIDNLGYEFISLGDIIINIDAMRRQAREYSHSEARETAFLTVHSALHLLGYDHGDAESEARMFAVQEEILMEMGLGR